MKYWTAWNEPNNPIWLQQYVGRQVHRSRASYAQICTAVWQGVHSTNFAEREGRLRRDRRRAATTRRHEPRPPCHRSPSCALTKAAGLKHLDAYAHNPYYGGAERDARRRSRGEEAPSTLGNMSTLIALVNKLYGKQADLDHRVRLPDEPPDRIFGVSCARQAAYLKQAFAIARENPRIDMMVWFLLRDDRTSRRLAVRLPDGGRQEEAGVQRSRLRDGCLAEQRAVEPVDVVDEAPTA